jgi:hypothetical protein
MRMASNQLTRKILYAEPRATEVHTHQLSIPVLTFDRLTLTHNFANAPTVNVASNMTGPNKTIRLFQT